VIFAYLSTPIDSAAVSISNGTTSCIIKHLKTLNKLDQSYPDNDVSLDSVDCEIFVKDRIDGIEKELRKKFRNTGYEDCVLTEIKKHGWHEYVALIFVYESSSHLSETDKNQKISESNERQTNILRQDVRWCKDGMTYGKTFDELWEAANETNDESEKNGLEDYCTRKYVVDEGFLDSNIFNVTLNPNNVSIEGFDCNELLKKKTKEMKFDYTKGFREGLTPYLRMSGKEGVNLRELTDKITECAITEFDEINLAGRILSIIVLGQLSPTHEQIQSEREKFIAAQRQLADAAILCNDSVK